MIVWLVFIPVALLVAACIWSDSMVHRHRRRQREFSNLIYRQLRS